MKPSVKTRASLCAQPAGRRHSERRHRRIRCFERLERRDLLAVDVTLGPFAAAGPPGSLIYEAAAAGSLTFAGETQRFLANFDAGQTISVSLDDLSVGFWGSVELIDPLGTSLASVSASAAGRATLLGPTATTLAGEYIIVVEAIGGTAGSFQTHVVLNAALEREELLGTDNGPFAAAEDINGSFLALTAGGAARGAVLGRSDGATGVVGPDSFGYAAIAVGAQFEDIRSTGSAILLDSDDAAVELSAADLAGFDFSFYGESHDHLYVSSNGLITFDAAHEGFQNGSLASLPETAAIAPLWDDLDSRAAADGVYWEVRGPLGARRLIVQWNDVHYFDHDASQSITFQAVLQQADGRLQFNYRDLDVEDRARDAAAEGTIGIKAGGPQPTRLLVKAAGSTSSLVGSGTSLQIGQGLLPEVPPDSYSFELTSGDSATLLLDGLAQSGGTLELVDAGGLLAAAVQLPGGELTIPNFVAPATGSYVARVTGRGADYQLIVTRNADLEREANSDLDRAQLLPVSGVALGGLDSEAPAAVVLAGNGGATEPRPAPLADPIEPAGSADTELEHRSTADDGPDTERLIVRFSASLTDVRKAELVAKHRGRLVTDLALINGAVIEVDDAEWDLERALRSWTADPLVAYAEPDYVVHTLATPNDPDFDGLWGLNNIGQTGGTVDADIDAVEAWDIFTGSSSVVVANIDTGVDYDHPDLAANMWVNPGEIPGDGLDNDDNGFVDDIYGIDTANNDSDPDDDDGHGTHTAGTVGAVGNNNVGVAGVNWDVQIMALKFISDTGFGFTSDAIDAISYMTMMKTQYGVNVVASNNSWGGGGRSQALRDAIRASNQAGIMFVAAAGNSSNNNDQSPEFPASYDLDGIISVAATDHNDRLASFSSFGATSVDLAAPGVSTLSTLPNNSYGRLSGTSMATPHVAGAAALLMAYRPTASLAEVKDAILSGIDPVELLQGRTLAGGRLNLANSLSAIADQGDFFQLHANAGNQLLLQTATPGRGPFDFENLVDPALELYAPSGERVAVDADGGSDQVNARIFHVAEESGVYTARVFSSAGAGEYVLEVSGHAGSVPEFQLLAASPPGGARLNTSPATYRVDFDGLVLVSSLDPSDLRVGGLPATGVTSVDGDTVQFELPPLPEGMHSISIAGGAIYSVQGTPLGQFSSQFVVDTTPPRIVSSSIEAGDVLPAGSLTYVAQFDEPLLEPVDLSAVTLLGTASGAHLPQSLDYDSLTATLTVSYSDLPDDGYTLRVASSSEGLRDLAGNLLDGDGRQVPSGDGSTGGDFALPFFADTDQFDVAPFEGLEPRGALLNQSQKNMGLLFSEVDVDQVAVQLQAGQVVAVEASAWEPAAQLQLELVDRSGQVLAEVLAGAGTIALLGPVRAGAAGEHFVRVSSDTTTPYEIAVKLNFVSEHMELVQGDDRLLSLDGSLTSVGTYAAVAASRPRAPQVEAVVWGAQPRSGMIVGLDPLSGEVLHQFAAPDALASGHTRVGLTIAERGKALLYVNSDLNPGTLFRLDPLTGALLSTETIDARGYAGLGFQSAPGLQTTVYQADLASDPGWTLEGLWEFGVPQGAGGDPGSGFTGNNVLGFNLFGEYPNDLSRTDYASAPPFDASEFSEVTLSFYRWLGVEASLFDQAVIEVSRDGTNWEEVWSNPVFDSLEDSTWTLQTFDISGVADGAPTVFLRWGLGPTDSSVTFAGWNLDDIRVSGVRDASPNILLGEPGVRIASQAGYSGPVVDHLTSVPPGGAVGGDDAGRMFIVAAGSGIAEIDPSTAETVLNTLPAPAADIEGLAFDGKTLYASTATGLVYSLNPDDGSVMGSFAVEAGALFGLAAAAVESSAERIIFAENFDGPTNAFTFDNSVGVGQGLWHLSSGRRTDGLPNHSPPQSAYFGKGEKDFGGGGYETGGPVAGEALSPLLQLPSDSAITLSFSTFIAVESFFEALEVLVDNGQVRTPVLSTTTATLTSSTGGVWRTISADLSAFAGQQVQLVFSFQADDSVNDFEGWYFDDVVVARTDEAFEYRIPDVDEYTVTLTGSGNAVDVVLVGHGQANFSSARLELVDVDRRSVLATAVPAAGSRGNLDLAIAAATVPADGVYSLRVTSNVAGAYTLALFDSLAFDSEPDAPSGALRQLETGSRALGFAGPNRSGDRLFAVEEPENPSALGTIHELDPLTGAVLNSFPTPNTPETISFGINLALDGDSLWYNAGAPFGDNRVYQLDVDTGEVINSSAMPGAPLFAGLARVGEQLFAVDGEIHVYDATRPTYPLLRTFPSPDFFSVGLAGNDELGSLYFLTQGFFGSGALYELDAESGAVLRTVAAASQLIEQGLAVVGSELFVSETGGAGRNEIAVYDQQTLAPVRRFSVSLSQGAQLAGLGGDGFSEEGPDNYRLELQAGDQLLIRTQTPFDAVGGSTVNTLNPALALYDAAGQQLATAVDGRPDGKNAQLEYTVPTAGTYRLEVFSELGSGEYLLFVDDGAEPPTLQVDSLELSASTVVVTFNGEFDSASLNVFDSSALSLGPADFTLHGDASGAVTGSLIVDAAARSVTFVKSGEPLAPDRYTVRLRSGIDAFREVSGGLLDGNGDGVAGDDFVSVVTVGTPAELPVVIGVSDVVRGPGQAVNVPADAATGIPVTISDGADVRAVDLRIRFDPDLLEITAATVAPGMPPGASVVLNNNTPGLAILVFFSATALPAGAAPIVHLAATVPAEDAASVYGRSSLLDVHAVTVSDGDDNERLVHEQDAVLLAAYFGDVSGNGRINASDAAQVARVAALIDTGFTGSLTTDPALLGDISGNGRINAADASLVARFAALLEVPQIPPIPQGVLAAGSSGSASSVTPRLAEPAFQRTAGRGRVGGVELVPATPHAEPWPVAEPSPGAVADRALETLVSSAGSDGLLEDELQRAIDGLLVPRDG